jgi:hypothetical protein
MTQGDEGGGASLTTDPAAGTSAATDISLREYFEALRHSDDKTDQWIFRFYEERDRRLTDVAVEREKALRIKEEADKRALDLQAETQAYKDEKANELREQINRERGLYATKDDVTAAIKEVQATIRPLAEYVTSQQGGPRAITTGMLLAAIGGLATVITVIVIAANYFTTH